MLDNTTNWFSMVSHHQCSDEEKDDSPHVQWVYNSKGHGWGEDLYSKCNVADPGADDSHRVYIYLQLFHSTRKLSWCYLNDTNTVLFNDCVLAEYFWYIPVLISANIGWDTGFAFRDNSGYYSAVFHKNQTKGKIY